MSVARTLVAGTWAKVTSDTHTAAGVRHGAAMQQKWPQNERSAAQVANGAVRQPLLARHERKEVLEHAGDETTLLRRPAGHGVGFARRRLAVGHYGRVEAAHACLAQRRRDTLEHGLLRRCFAEESVEREGLSLGLHIDANLMRSRCRVGKGTAIGTESVSRRGWASAPLRGDSTTRI